LEQATSELKASHVPIKLINIGMNLKEGEERRGRSSKLCKDDFEVDTRIKR
jgi:hypothetical protein